jgi:electron transfer flavoprotein alpha subunit
MTSLVLAEHGNNALSDATGQAVRAAAALGSPVHVLVAGHGCHAVAEAASRLAGVETVLVADDTLYAHALAEPLATLILSLADRYEAFVAPATATGKSIMPRVAAILDVPQISEINKVLSRDTFERPIYAGRIIQTVQAPAGKLVLTVRSSAFASVGDGGDAAVVSISAAEDPALSRFVREERAQSDRPDLATARRVVAGGRGLQTRENFDRLERVASILGAAVGGTRAAVDGGFIPNPCQIGQTGKVIAPDLYLAVGISGAIQHLAGIKDAKLVVAINKDEEAPIFSFADIGLVADAFAALPVLEEKLRNRSA